MNTINRNSVSIDTTALNESSNWQVWEKETDLILSQLREYGLDEEALRYVGTIISREASNQTDIEIYYQGTTMQQPTQSTGGGNYYYWHRAGNAYFDDNYDNDDVLIFKIRLVEPERLRLEALIDEGTFFGDCYAPGKVNSRSGKIQVYYVKRNCVSRQEFAEMVGLDSSLGDHEWAAMGVPERSGQIKNSDYENSFFIVFNDDPERAIGFSLPEDLHNAGVAGLSRWAVRSAGYKGASAAEEAYWSAVAAVQNGQLAPTAVNLPELLQQMDDFLHKRSSAPKISELRTIIDGALK